MRGSTAIPLVSVLLVRDSRIIDVEHDNTKRFSEVK